MASAAPQGPAERRSTKQLRRMRAMTHDCDWALVADARRARVFQRRAPAGAWAELESEGVARDDAPSRDLGSDRPGRVHESVGGARHAIEPRSDPHAAAEAAFARDLAERLATAAGEGRYRRLALVAPPAFLGELRHALPPALGPLVMGTLDKDLTHQPPEEIAARLGDLHAP
jgi:protein required for attachment to host cells